MNKKYVLFFLLIILLISGCNKKMDFAEEGPFIKLTTYPGGANIHLEYYPRNISVYDDGTIHIFTEATGDILVEEDAPEVKIKLDDKAIEEIKNTIHNQRFFQLDQNLSETEVMDGEMQYITVHTKTESKEVGGESPLNGNFQSIREKILNYVSEDYDQWLEDIDDYIYEKNPSETDG